MRYVSAMTATAERLLDEIRRLPAADREEICRSVSQLAANIQTAPKPDEVLQAIRASHGLFAGSGLTGKLLEDRARERQREEAEAQARRIPHG
jgi:hypothetical protein